MDVRSLLSEGILILDGAMGTMLQKYGLKPGGQPELMNINSPEVVRRVHEEYLNAGSQMILTNTFGANCRKLLRTGHKSAEVVECAVKIAKQAAYKRGAFVALDIGPIGELMEPAGNLSFEEAYEIFKEQVEAGVSAGVDAIAIETMTDLLEIKCALLAAKEHSGLPVFCTMSFEQDMRTFMGVSLSSMALTLEGLGADAVGFNCSVGPAEMVAMVQELGKWTNLPIIAKPNAGLPTVVNGVTVFNVTPDGFSRYIDNLLELGTGIVGGCCGTSPEFIERLALMTRGRKPVERPAVELSAVCSHSKTVLIDRVRTIGERINPTGKKKLCEALLADDMDYIAELAIDQADEGADIIDVNVGLPGADEKLVMPQAVKAIQSVVASPLQIDSSSPEAIEAALRVYNGKPIVNSVNGKPEVLKKILPLVKKYGAAVVGLTLDEKGIPHTAAGRYEIAERIVAEAVAHGIPKRDVFIDCLTLTSGAMQEAAYAAIEATALVKNKLNVRTELGISNISFGLPAREKLNRAFLAAALANGLDLPILNTGDAELMDTVCCFHQLRNIDIGSIAYTERFGKGRAAQTKERGLAYCIENGLKDEVKPIVELLLEDGDGLSVVEDFLTPALDAVGRNYESGKIFLPQLLLAAETAKAVLEVVRNRFPGTGGNAGKLILATVKGDVHDIGKNIVKAVLQNYGFEVIDMGRDVDAAAVAEAAVEHEAALVGLSALMTTTVESMRETICALKKAKPEVAVIVGGAVLTQELADSIGADFYAKGPMAAVSVAKKILQKQNGRCAGE